MMTQTNQLVLVTGGSGFVGSYCILQLLAEGYRVRTSVRSLSRETELRATLHNAGAQHLDKLSFVEADLQKDIGWAEAVNGCDYVLHVASPFPSGQPRHEDELIIPAREGTLRVLKAARQAAVKRVVMTSSFAAIGYSINPVNHVFTEEDWTDPTAVIVPYIKSKTLAERAAWDYIRQQSGKLELTVINPVGIFGPVLGADFSSSIQLVQQLISGKMPLIPKLSFGLVDVRDVADIHLRAMLSPQASGQRFLAAADATTSLPEIARLLHAQEGEGYRKVSTKVLPDWVVRLAARFKPDLKTVAAQLGLVKVLSNQKAKRVLNWQPRAKEVTILDTAQSLIDHQLTHA